MKRLIKKLQELAKNYNSLFSVGIYAKSNGRLEIIFSDNFNRYSEIFSIDELEKLESKLNSYLVKDLKKQLEEKLGIAKKTDEEIREAIEKGDNLWYLCEYQTLSPELQKLYIEKGENLYALYEYQALLPELQKMAIKKGKGLNVLYKHQKLSPDIIKLAIEKGFCLRVLYQYQTLSPELQKLAIEVGDFLCFLYEYQTLLPEVIELAIEKGEVLEVLYNYQFNQK